MMFINIHCIKVDPYEINKDVNHSKDENSKDQPAIG